MGKRVEAGTRGFFRVIIGVPVAIVKDIVTLGGSCNDAMFQDEGGTYTGKQLRRLGRDIAEVVEGDKR